MKKLLYLLILSMLFILPCFANSENGELNNNSLSGYEKAKQYYYYLDFYYVIPESISMHFVPLEKKKEKFLTKKQKKLYKQYKKIEKYLARGQFAIAYNINRTYLPTLTRLYHYEKDKKNYGNAINVIEEIKRYDTHNIFDIDRLNTEIGELAFWNGDYKKSIEMLLPIYDKKQPNNNLYRAMISSCYYYLEDYNNALIQANKISKTDLECYKIGLTVKYDTYIAQNKKDLANKVAYEMFSYSCPSKYLASLYIADTANNNDVKLKFYNIAKQNANEDKDIWKLNYKIAQIEQQNLDNLCKRVISGYFKTPNWLNIAKQDIEIMSIKQENERFDQYHKELKNCTAKYTGNNLKACLNEIIYSQEKITQRLISEQQEKNRQLAEQQRLLEMQQMNYNLRMQNALQAEQNTLIRQQNYELSRPRYYNSTTTQYGNTYYTNSYSY